MGRPGVRVLDLPGEEFQEADGRLLAGGGGDQGRQHRAGFEKGRFTRPDGHQFRPDTEVIELRLRRARELDAEDRQSARYPVRTVAATSFSDIGFAPGEAAELTVKSTLVVIAIKDAMQQRKLTQQQAAQLCETNQPTLSKVFRGRMESVMIDRPVAANYEE